MDDHKRLESALLNSVGIIFLLDAEERLTHASGIFAETIGIHLQEIRQEIYRLVVFLACDELVGPGDNIIFPGPPGVKGSRSGQEDTYHCQKPDSAISTARKKHCQVYLSIYVLNIGDPRISL